VYVAVSAPARFETSALTRPARIVRMSAARRDMSIRFPPSRGLAVRLNRISNVLFASFSIQIIIID
jgi:hypothetical protein